MADTEDTTDEGGKGKKAKTPADEKRREQVLVGAAVAGVILTVLLLRKSGNNAQAPLPVSAPVGNTNNGGGSGVSSGDFMSLQNQVYGLQGTLSGLEVSMGLSSSPTGISSNPTPGKFTGADVEDLFAQHGLTIGPDQGETSQQREDRIVRQLNSGTRTPAQVSKSIAGLSGAK